MPQPRPFEPEDLGLFQDLGQLHVSTARNIAACVVRSVDLAADDDHSAIWTFALDGTGARKFTLGTSGDNHPRWSPDGSLLAFISPRDGLPQVHVIPVDGGEARQLTHLASGVGSFEWSPDGKRLLALCALNLDRDSRDLCRVVEQAPPPDAPEVCWRVPYKSDGIGYILGRTFQMFDIDAASGEGRQISHGSFDVLAAAWSPDGERIAYVRTREGRHAHRTDLWTCDAGGGNARQLTSQIASTMAPRWAPHGRRIAFCGARDEGDAQTRLFEIPADGGEPRQLGHDGMEVASAESVSWMRDGGSLLLVEAHEANQRIVRVDAQGGAVAVLVGGMRQVSEIACSEDRLVYFSESATSPRELCAARLDGSEERRLSFLNTWWDDRTPLEAELRAFTVPDGEGGEETIRGWFIRAKGSPSPQPLLVEAHGGPNSLALLGYPWNVYWNVLCSRGWAIAVPHAVGSTSFGRRFAERLNGRWGELDFPQYMSVVDALQRDGIASDRLAIAGKSYGGYMAAWAIGHTDRFRAAVVSAPVANLESHYGTSDGGYYSQPYTLSGERFIEPERYRALSPVNFVQNAVTPTLILQGKEDERCPRGQAEELFAVLMRCERAPTEMVMYPGGGHHFFETGKPSHRLDAVRRLVEWVEKWVEPRA